MLKIQPPFPVYVDTSGEPLESGFIFIGTTGLEPESNPLSTFWDEDLLYPAPQPIRTIGGIPSRNGSAANIYISETTYSIKVLDKNENLVYSATSQDDNVPAESITADNIDSSDVDEIQAKLGIDGWIIVGSQANADYATLAAYLADSPQVGDRVLVTETQATTTTITLPDGIEVKFLRFQPITTSSNLTDVLVLGQNTKVTGILEITLSHTGTITNAIRYEGNGAYIATAAVFNASTGTITNGVVIDINLNSCLGSIGVSGTGTLTNAIVDNSGDDTNYVIVRGGIGLGSTFRSDGALRFRNGLEFDLGSDADGDIYYRDAGILKRLAKGLNGEILTLSSGLPAWSASSSVQQITSDGNWVTNGSFDTDSDWVKGTGWTISAGLATKAAGVASDLSQTGVIDQDSVLYVVDFTVSGRTAGSVTIKIGTSAGTSRSTNGTFSENITSPGSGQPHNVILSADSSFDGSIDDVKVYRLQGGTPMVFDNSVPLNTEGNEYIRATITPSDAANKLTVWGVGHFGLSSIDNAMGIFLCQDSISEALIVGAQSKVGTAGVPCQMVLPRYEMIAGTTSPIIFRMFAGQFGAATTTFNGIGGARVFGGKYGSFLTVKEEAP